MFKGFARELVGIVPQMELAAIHKHAVAWIELVKGKALAEAPLQERAPCFDIKLQGQKLSGSGLLSRERGLTGPRSHHLHFLREWVEQQLVVPYYVRGGVQPFCGKRIPQGVRCTLQTRPSSIVPTIHHSLDRCTCASSPLRALLKA